MKTYSKFLAFFFAGALATTGFTSCSDDDTTIVDDRENPVIENRWTGTNAEMWNATKQYVDNVIYPTYTNLATKADELYNASVTMQAKFKAGSLTDADVQAVCTAFEGARYYWERSEAFLYGAASDYEIDPHIDSWPLDQSQMANFLSNPTMVAGLNGDDPIKFVSDNNGSFDTALGFHGVEFVLYRDGAPRKAEVFNGNETHESFAGKTVPCAEEISFLVAVTGDLRDHCYWLEVAWLGQAAPQAHRDRIAALGVKTHALSDNGYYYGANLLLTGNGKSQYTSMPEALATILDSGCSNICQEVYSQKMGQAYRVATGHGTSEDAGNYIESPYSKHSFIDYQGNILSIQNSLYGTMDGTQNANSIMSYLENHNYENAAALKSALKNAIAALQTCIDSGIAFVDNPGHAQVGTAINAVQELDDQLQTAKQWIEKQ